MSTLVYKYGLLPPTANAELIDEQLRLAHRYQNALVEIERRRRTARDEVISSVPDVATVMSIVAGLEADLEAERTRLKAENIQARKTGAGDPTHAQNIRAKLKEQWPRLKAARKAAMELPEVKEKIQAIYDQAKSEIKAARAACGVYWGTYGQIEKAAEQASKAVEPPRFRPWTGDGSLTVQVMATAGQGEKQAINHVFDGQNTMVQITPDALPIPGRGGKSRQRLRLRIGTSQEGREPIYAEWPIILHRPFPEGSSLKYASVSRRRVGTHYQWTAQFTLGVEEPKAVEGKAVAVNLRWSATNVDGESTTTSSDWHSETGIHGVLPVTPQVASHLEKVDSLQSIRDRFFNEEREKLKLLFAGLTLPLEFAERIKHFSLWKAQAKLAALVLWWRGNRFDGDTAAYMIAEAWRHQDKHLYDWESNARQKALARRKDDYRVFAAGLVRTHKVLVIEKLKLNRLAEKPQPEEERDLNPKSSSQRFGTSPSELRACLVNAFRREGGRVVEVAAGYTSKEMLEQFLKGAFDTVTKKSGKSERTTRLLRGKKLAASASVTDQAS